MLLVVGARQCTAGDGLLWLPTTGGGQCAPGVDLVLLLCVFLGLGLYWLNLQLYRL